MEKTRIRELGSVGVNTDMSPWDLPENVFTNVNNVRCIDGYIGNFGGKAVLDTLPASTIPYHIMTLNTGTDYYWIVQGDDAVYAWDGVTFTDITSTSGYASFLESSRWSGSTQGQIVTQANPRLYPEYWDGLITSNFVDLPYKTGQTWRSMGYYAHVLRGFKGHGIALGVTKGASEYPHMVKWSDPVGPGAAPIDWDETSTTNRAGEQDLGDAGGVIVDGAAQRDSFKIYKQDSIWTMDYIGGNSVWKFRPIITTNGALALDCIQEVRGTHYVFADGDIIRHNGTVVESILEKRVRKNLTATIDPTYYQNSFTVRNSSNNELWFCYPETGEEYPSRAIIYNWNDDTISYRDLDNPHHIIAGPLLGSTESWNGDPDVSWEEWVGVWDANTFGSLIDTNIGVTPDQDMSDYTSEAPDAAFDAIIERDNIPSVGDSEKLSTITEVFPYMTGGAVEFYVGSQMMPGGDITWEGPFAFDPSTDRKFNCRVTGALHGYRIKSDTSIPWSISGLDVTWSYAGER